MLKLENVSKYYRISRKKKIIVDKADFEIKKKEIVALTGKSGCGKTTLLNIIAGLTSPSSGKVYFNGKRVIYFMDIMPSFIRNRKVGFIFQTFKLLNNESVLSNVLLPARIKGFTSKIIKTRADVLLEKLQIEEFKKTRVGLLSGGQKQRVAIARALINDPSLILADEPTANLDKTTSTDIFKALEDIIRQDDKALFIVTHKTYMLKHADRIFDMKEGALREKT